MKKYKIKPEYIDLWGSEADADTIVTDEDIVMVSRGWETNPEEIMDQLVEIEPAREALATIDTEIGTMTIFFNGAGEELTAEKDDTVDEIGYKPTSAEDAVDVIEAMYCDPCWGLNLCANEREELDAHLGR